MFYCPLHSWYSTEEPCKICHPKVNSTRTVAINTGGTTVSYGRVYTEDDMRKCFYAAIHIDGGGRADTFEDYLKTIIRQL